jgi:hypothetical protein
MYNGYRFIDSDAHIIEPRDMFEKYLEPKFRAEMPIAWADYQGEPLAMGFEVRIPHAGGEECVMPFGRDPLGLDGGQLDDASGGAGCGFPRCVAWL